MLPPADQETIWVKWATSKANVHLWRVQNNRLATRDNLSKRRVSISSPDCTLCNSNLETVDHIFGTCSTSKIVNAHLSHWISWWPAGGNSAWDLWKGIDSKADNDVDRNVRRIIMTAFFWVLWKQTVRSLKGT